MQHCSLSIRRLRSGCHYASTTACRAVAKLVLVLAVLMLPVQFVTNGFGAMVDDAHVARPSVEMDDRCIQAYTAGTACMAEDPLEVSGAADAADALARETASAASRILALMPVLHAISFPASVYPRIASPPPRA